MPERLGSNQTLAHQADQTAADVQLKISDLKSDIAAVDSPRIARFVERSVLPVGPRRSIRLVGGFITGFAIYLAALIGWRWSRRQFSGAAGLGTP